MIGREIPNTFLESPDIVLSLVPDPNWYLKVDQISPTLKYMNSAHVFRRNENGFLRFRKPINSFNKMLDPALQNIASSCL